MSKCIICKKNCSPVKVAIFDGEGGLLGYGSKDCMQKANMQNTGVTTSQTSKGVNDK